MNENRKKFYLSKRAGVVFDDLKVRLGGDGQQAGNSEVVNYALEMLGEVELNSGFTVEWAAYLLGVLNTNGKKKVKFTTEVKIKLGFWDGIKAAFGFVVKTIPLPPSARSGVLKIENRSGETRYWENGQEIDKHSGSFTDLNKTQIINTHFADISKHK